MTNEQAKHLKEGDTVLVRGVVEFVGNKNVSIAFKHSNGEKNCVGVSMEDVGAAWAIPSNPPESPAPCTSKYDPCRWFKKGDKVRVVDYKGRGIGLNGSVMVVEKDENVRENKVLARHVVGGLWQIDAAYLELVTPVEELEPYRVEESTHYFGVDKGDEELCLYWKDKHPYAKEAAEAECARLNAEHRKEEGK